MDTEISAPPFTLDVRVARSPLMGLRYGIDGRATDIDDVIQRLEEAHAEASVAREDATGRLRPYEGSHQAILERIIRGSGRDFRQRLDEALEVRIELARLDERVSSLRERIDGLREQRQALRDISASLAKLDTLSGASIDDAGAAQNQAVRQLFHMIDVDHDATAQHILDGPMQMLADAALQTDVLDRVDDGDSATVAFRAASFRQSTDAALRELQTVIFEIHPDELRRTGLVPAVRRLVAGLGGVEAQVLVLGRARRLRRGVEVAMFRIVQAAASNAVAHGNATSVEVVILFQPGRVSLVVRDDGEGFDVAATEARLGRSRGWGLISMRQRADVEQGRLEVRSMVGQGTEVRASFASPD